METRETPTTTKEIVAALLEPTLDDHRDRLDIELAQLRLLLQTGGWLQAAELLQRRAETADDPERATRSQLALALIYGTELEETERAITALLRAQAIAPADFDSLLQLVLASARETELAQEYP